MTSTLVQIRADPQGVNGTPSISAVEVQNGLGVAFCVMTRMNERAAHRLLSLAEEAGVQLKGLDAKAWRDRLESQYPDLEAAIGWLLDHGLSEDALKMAVALYHFWTLTGRIALGRTVIDRALGAGVSNDSLRASALYHEGLLAFWQGDDDAANALHQRSLDLARQLANPTAAALALVGLARVKLREGDLDGARALCEEALLGVEGTNDQLGRSNALHVLAVTAQMRGDLLEARERMTQRMQLARELGSFGGVAGEASNLSHVERRLGNLKRAEQLALEALQIAERRGDEWLIPYVLSALAATAAEGQQFVRATQLLGAATQMMEDQGAALPPDEAPLFEQTRAAAAKALGPIEFDTAWDLGRAMPFTEAVSYAMAARVKD